MYSQGSKVSSCGQRRLWSAWANAQADLSLRCAHTHFVGFVMSRRSSYIDSWSLLFLQLYFYISGVIFVFLDLTHLVRERSYQPVACCRFKVSSGLPVADSVAGCRFSCQFETTYVRTQVASCRFSCRLPIQLPIRNRQVQRIGNRQLVVGCRFSCRFETTRCRLPIQIRNGQYKFNESATGN